MVNMKTGFAKIDTVGNAGFDTTQLKELNMTLTININTLPLHQGTIDNASPHAPPS